MGYTTAFKGQFDCYRVDNPEMGAFLKTVYEGEHTAIGVFADWLMEQDDPRGEQIVSLRAGSAEAALAFWRMFGLLPEHAGYLTKFNETRRMKRDPTKAALLPDPFRQAGGLAVGVEGAYFVGGDGFRGQEEDESVLDGNSPPSGQPGLWCRWRPREDGTAIVWDEGEKFYHYVEWLDYLIRHFLNPWGYVLNGKMNWRGEERKDRGIITVNHNRIFAKSTTDNRD